MLVQPALGTQELRLQTLGARHRAKLFAASAWREQLRVVMEGEEDLEENGLLSPQFVHVSHTLKEY
jgi:predicted hydrolase (HD superfamily)